MKRVHESNLNPSGLVPTLQQLGVRGVMQTAILNWQCYPFGASAAIFDPGPVDGSDGPAVGFIAPNILSLPYYATHLNWSSRTNEGAHICQWKIQDSSGVTRRVLRFQNPAKDTSGQQFGQSVVNPLVPIPLLPSQGVQARLAAERPIVTPALEMRAYLTVLRRQPLIVPELMAVAPPALGATLPTTAAGTVITENAASWTYGSYVQINPAGFSTAALITAVIFSSTSTSDGQVAFATGGIGIEVDWGVFGWAEPVGSNLVAVRYDLQPFPLFVAPGRVVSARARGTNGGNTFNVGLEYIPLPLR